MVLLRRPTSAAIDAFIAEQLSHDFTYPAESVGATLKTPFHPPSGFTADRTRVQIGSGEKAFAAAKIGLERWRPYDLGWMHASPGNTPIVAGNGFATVVRYFGLWWVNACRIIAVIDTPTDVPASRFGFAFGTLPSHAECGEERFMIEWNRQDDSVWYDILAFSRPRHLLPRLAVPLARRLQKRFARDSADGMKTLTMNNE